MKNNQETVSNVLNRCSIAVKRAVKLTMVPFTWVVTWPLPSWFRGLERPKSETFVWRFPSRRMLLDFISLCTIGGSASSCRYAMPFAAPSTTRSRLFQSRRTPDFPEKDVSRICLFSQRRIADSVMHNWTYGHTCEAVLECAIGHILIDQHLLTLVKAKSHKADKVLVMNPG